MLTASQRDFVLLHAAFGGLCGLTLPLVPLPIGQCLLLLTLTYHIALPLWAWWRGHSQWIQIVAFVWPFAWLNVFPDWFLSAYLHVLVYPDEGVFKLGSVGGYMPGLWAIPMFVLLYLSSEIAERIGTASAYAGALVLGMLMFWPSEQLFKDLGSWYATGVKMVGQAAIYVLCAEAVLSVVALAVYRAVAPKPFLLKVAGAFVLMLLYLGSLVFFYFLIEVLSPQQLSVGQ
jgi:hypothetical protein